MSEISILGLGLMGAALAHELQRHGHSMTVWNRSPEKMQPFTDRGAHGALNLVEAVTASPILLICVDDYSVTRSLLEVENVTNNLIDRTVVQLSTGTPLEAYESAEWFKSYGARYIDGAILAGPETLGTESAQIIFSGPEDVFAGAELLLKSLCQKIRYLGDNIRSASALDLAWLCRDYGMFMGVTHGAVLCESEGVSLDLYAQMFPESDYAHDYVNTIHNKEFENTSATLNTWGAALQNISKQAHNAGINSEIPQFISSLFDRAMQAGHGEEDVAALIKILRKNQS